MNVAVLSTADIVYYMKCLAYWSYERLMFHFPVTWELFRSAETSASTDLTYAIYTYTDKRRYNDSVCFQRHFH